MRGKDKISANPRIVLRDEFENHAFLYDPDAGDTFQLNPVGIHIWRHLDGRHTVEQLVGTLNQHFDNVPDSSAEDIIQFLADLKKRGFID